MMTQFTPKYMAPNGALLSLTVAVIETEFNEKRVDFVSRCVNDETIYLDVNRMKMKIKKDVFC